jgi:hypothetical protein
MTSVSKENSTSEHKSANNSMQRSALLAAADLERWTDRQARPLYQSAAKRLQ